MNDTSFLIGVGVAVVAAVSFVLFHIYSGVHGSLHSARVGEVYNFEYEQPLHGDPDRYLAKVLSVHELNDADIRRLNSISRYRRNDPIFQRTRHLVTCQTSNGEVRNFYAERAKNVRKPLLGSLLIKTKVASLLF